VAAEEIITSGLVKVQNLFHIELPWDFFHIRMDQHAKEKQL